MGNNVRIVTSVDDNASGPLDRIRDKFDQMGKGAASASLIGNAGAMALQTGVRMLGDAAGAVVDEIQNAVQKASDLNESASKSEVVFGEAAGAMSKFASGAADALGMSKQAALEAGATFGNFFKGVGQSSADAEIMSEKIVTLAGDLASFNNLDPTDVLTKLRSGLTGEAEPLRSMGVFLTEAKVKAKAMQMGLLDAHGELSEGSKVLARYQIILDETKSAQGDFARTSEGLANTQRRTNAAIEDAEASLGQAWIPYAKGLDQAKLATIKFATDGLNAWDTIYRDQLPRIEQQGDLASRIVTQILDPYGLALEATAATASQASSEWQRALSDGAAGVEDGGRRIQAATTTIAGDMKVGFIDSSLSAELAVIDAMEGVGDSVEGVRDRIKTASQSLINDAWDPLINAAEIKSAKLELADAQQQLSTKKLTESEKAQLELRILNLNKNLAQLLSEQSQYGTAAATAGFADAQFTKEQILAGLQSKDPEVRKHWEDYVKAQAAAHDAAAQEALAGGANIGASLDTGIGTGITDNKASATGPAADVVNTLGGYRPNGDPVGYAWVSSIADGIQRGDSKLAGVISQVVGSKMIGFSPPKEGPLSTIDKGGENIGKAWLGGLADGISSGGGVEDAISQLAELMSAGPGGSAVAASGGAGGSGGRSAGGVVININVDRGAYIDGPSIDALARTIAQRLNLVGIG